MNEVLKCIKERRTTRRFRPEQIKEEELQAIIEAGLYAPSSANQQSWNFTVIQNREFLDEMNFYIKEVLKQSDNEDFKRVGENEKFIPTYGAPTVIIVSGFNDAYSKDVDCAAASQNMLLAAQSLGIASCWSSVAAVAVTFDGEKKEEYMAKLNIQDNYTPLYGILLGYSDNTPKNASKRKENTVQYVR